MSVEQRIIDRLIGLKAKTVESGCTPEEAAAAAAKMQELLFKHNLELADIEVASSDYTYEELDLGVEWLQYLISTIAKYNFCRALVRADRDDGMLPIVVIIGKPHNIAVVRWMYDYLRETITGLADVQWKRYSDIYSEWALLNDEAIWRDSFGMGCVVALDVRLERQQRRDTYTRQGYALVHSIDNELWTAVSRLFSHVMHGESPRITDRAAFQSGQIAGLDIPLNAPLRESAPAPQTAFGRLLLPE